MDLVTFLFLVTVASAITTGWRIATYNNVRQIQIEPDTSYKVHTVISIIVTVALTIVVVSMLAH